MLETCLLTVVVDGSPKGHRRILAMAFFFRKKWAKMQIICTLWMAGDGLFDAI